MAFLKKENSPSLKREMERLDKQDGGGAESIKQGSELKYTPELLQEMQEELADAQEHLTEVSSDNSVRVVDTRESDLEFWRERIASSSRTIRKLEALRDQASKKE